LETSKQDGEESGALLDKVEVGQGAIVCRIHTHRGNPNAILKLDIANLERSEESGGV
jgi:hypothetical protein